MRNVHVVADGTKFGQDITVGPHRLRADEGEHGGADTGLEPYELLLSALGACTSMTLRMYAERKGWALRGVQVVLSGGAAEGKYTIARRITLEGELDAEQRQRLIEIANRCPVHRTLTGEVVIQTTEEPA